jgi:hypothetical protein
MRSAPQKKRQAHRLVEDEERAAKKTSGADGVHRFDCLATLGDRPLGSGFRNGRLCCGLAIGRFLREAQRSQPRGFLPFGTALLRVFYHGRVLILFSE